MLPLPFKESRELPDYRAILAVDAEGYTKHPGSLHEGLTSQIQMLAKSAMQDSGLADVWARPEFFEGTGDGFGAGFSPRILPFLVHPFAQKFQERLQQHQWDYRGSVPLRVRISINVGPLPVDSSASGGGGNGDARNNTHRLLDCAELKRTLKASSPEVTFVALIVSDRVFDDAVRPGYCGLHPDAFRQVDATVPGKEFSQRAWIHVPRESTRGGMPPEGLERTEAKMATAAHNSDEGAACGGIQPSVNNDSGTVNFGNLSGSIVNGNGNWHG